MKKILYIILIILFLFVGIIFFKFNVLNDKVFVKINNAEFEVELAQTPEDQYRGLSGKEKMGENKGVLFLFKDYKKRNFIMRDMNFSLDIVWIRDKKVINCTKNVPILAPDGSVAVVNSKSEVNKVLEINAGKCDEFKIKSGDIVDMILK